MAMLGPGDTMLEYGLLGWVGGQLKGAMVGCDQKVRAIATEVTTKAVDMTLRFVRRALHLARAGAARLEQALRDGKLTSPRQGNNR